MSIVKVIALINQMQGDGVIERYAIGGAVGATFHLEPISTLDVDIFVSFEHEPGSPLISPKPILDYLTARGCRTEGEYVVIAARDILEKLQMLDALRERALALRPSRCAVPDENSLRDPSATYWVGKKTEG
jgi:hypothetical protein